MNLAPEIECLAGAKSEEDLHAAIVVACREWGFKWGSGFAAWREGQGPWQFRHVGLMPIDYLDIAEDSSKNKLDPVVQYVKRSGLPIFWNKRTYEIAGQAELWEIQSPYGYATGVTGAMHFAKCNSFVFGFDGVDEFWSGPRERTSLLGRFQTFQAHMEAAFTRIIEWPRTANRADWSQVTRRELECLKWSAEGKTLWEIGQLLNISERTVKKHMASAMAALDCVSKTHAVARAIRMQLI